VDIGLRLGKDLKEVVILRYAQNNKEDREIDPLKNPQG
jgi:hypothetical protein